MQFSGPVASAGELAPAWRMLELPSRWSSGARRSQHYPRKLRLESPFGNFTVDVAVAAEVPAVDVLWLTVKATQLEQALRPFKNPDAVRAIVPLLNGIDHVALLRARVRCRPRDSRDIAGETERVSPGHIVHRSPFARLNVSSAGEICSAAHSISFSKSVLRAVYR
jgi:ketopantoate reductase